MSSVLCLSLLAEIVALSCESLRRLINGSNRLAAAVAILLADSRVLSIIRVLACV